MVTNNLKFTNQVIKYLVYGLIVYTLFSYVPQKQLPSSDIILMTTVIIVSFIILDFLTPAGYEENFDQLYENLDVDAIDNIEQENNDISENEEQENDTTDNKKNENSGISVSYINSNKPEILKKLQNNKVLDENEINNILKLCSDKDECNKKFLDLLNNNKINNDELLELYIAFGLNKYNTLQELYLQERLTSEQALEIAYAISSNSKLFSEAIVKKYLKNNIINNDDYNKIISDLNLDDDNNEGRSYISNMIINDIITTKNAKIINDKCFSSSMDSCSIQINKFKKDKLLNDSQAISILKGFNKPGINDVIYDNNDFGSISNEYKVGSVNEQTDLGNVKFKNELLSDDDLLKQSKSRDNNKNFNNIDINSEDIEENEDSSEDKNNDNEENKFDLDEFNKAFDSNKKNKKEEKQKINEKYRKYLNVKSSKKYNKNNDMKYSVYSDRQTEPLGSFSKDFTNTFEHGYTYLQTDKWNAPDYDNTVCKIENKCNICEEDYEGYPVDVSKWNHSRKILPRDNININYIKDKLNTGNV